MSTGKLLAQFNNSQVIGVTGGKEVRNMSHIDSSILGALDMTKTDSHLGLVNFFEATGMVKNPLFMKDILQSRDVIRVNGRSSKFTYDVDMGMEYPTVVQDIDQSEDFPGIAQTPFKINLSHPFRPGDILTYSLTDGIQVIVSEDIPVQNTGIGYIHTVTINHQSEHAYFPKDKLAKGTRFFKAGHAMGEYSQDAWSGITGSGTPKRVKLEYQIGAVKGVEVGYTDWANSMNLNGENARWMSDSLLNAAMSLTGDDKDLKDKFVVYGKQGANGMVNSGKVEKLLPMLALAELYKINSTALMFSQGSIQTGSNGAKRVSEGIYPQVKKGNRLTYNNDIELRIALKQAADIIFSGASAMIDVYDRHLKFKGGKRFVDIVRNLFANEFKNTYPLALEAASLPGPLLTGKNLNDLTYTSFAIKKAFLNEIGHVEVMHDVSMDFDLGDVVQVGYTGGMNKRSYSGMIWKASSSEYSNARNKSLLPDGVTVEEGAKGNNLYLVKPRDVADVSWGSEKGRVDGTNVASVGKHQGETFWCKSQMDAWIPDLSEVILIEQPDTLTEDFYRF